MVRPVIIIMSITSVISSVAVHNSFATSTRPCEYDKDGEFDTFCEEPYFPSLPLCGKGYKLNTTCVTPRQSSKVCVACDPGHFQSYDNHCWTCNKCSDCGSRRTVHPCNVEQDTICEDPMDVTYSDSLQSTALSTVTTDETTPGDPSSVTPGLTPGTAPGATPEVTPGMSSTSKTTPSWPQEFLSTLTTSGLVCNIDLSTQDGTRKAVISLAVCLVLVTFLLMVALGGCCHYRRKAKENLRRVPRHDGDVEGQACKDADFIPLDQRSLEGSPPPSPATPPIDRPDGRYQQFKYPGGAAEGDDQCHPPPPKEALYAVVNKPGKSSKATMTDDQQRPSTSSGDRCHKNVVCKTIRKLKDNSKRDRKKTGPGSETEKGQLLKHKNPDPPPSVFHSTSKTPSLPTTSYPCDKQQTVTAQTQPAVASPPQSPRPSTTVSLPRQLPQSSSPPSQSSSVSLPSSTSPSLSTLPPPPPSLQLPQPSTSPLPSTALPSLSTSALTPPPLINSSQPQSSPFSSSPPPPSTSSLPVLPSTSRPSSQQLPSPPMPPSSPSSSSPRPSTSSLPPSSSTSSLFSPIPPSPLPSSPAQTPPRSLSPVLPPPPSSSSPPRPPPILSSSKPTQSSHTPSSMPSREEVVEKNKDMPKNPSINPDEVVCEGFLDSITDVVTLTEVERVARTCGLQQVEIDNVKVSKSHSGPKNVGFHILLAVLKLKGCSLTYGCLVKAIKDCNNKDAADTLITDYSINMTLETR